MASVDNAAVARREARRLKGDFEELGKRGDFSTMSSSTSFTASLIGTAKKLCIAAAATGDARYVKSASATVFNFLVGLDLESFCSEHKVALTLGTLCELSAFALLEIAVLSHAPLPSVPACERFVQAASMMRCDAHRCAVAALRAVLVGRPRCQDQKVSKAVTLLVEHAPSSAEQMRVVNAVSKNGLLSPLRSSPLPHPECDKFLVLSLGAAYAHRVGDTAAFHRRVTRLAESSKSPVSRALALSASVLQAHNGVPASTIHLASVTSAWRQALFTKNVTRVSSDFSGNEHLLLKMLDVPRILCMTVVAVAAWSGDSASASLTLLCRMAYQVTAGTAEAVGPCGAATLLHASLLQVLVNGASETVIQIALAACTQLAAVVSPGYGMVARSMLWAVVQLRLLDLGLPCGSDVAKYAPCLGARSPAVTQHEDEVKQISHLIPFPLDEPLDDDIISGAAVDSDLRVPHIAVGGCIPLLIPSHNLLILLGRAACVLRVSLSPVQCRVALRCALAAAGAQGEGADGLIRPLIGFATFTLASRCMAHSGWYSKADTRALQACQLTQASGLMRLLAGGLALRAGVAAFVDFPAPWQALSTIHRYGEHGGSRPLTDGVAPHALPVGRQVAQRLSLFNTHCCAALKASSFAYRAVVSASGDGRRDDGATVSVMLSLGTLLASSLAPPHVSLCGKLPAASLASLLKQIVGRGSQYMELGGYRSALSQIRKNFNFSDDAERAIFSSASALHDAIRSSEQCGVELSWCAEARNCRHILRFLLESRSSTKSLHEVETTDVSFKKFGEVLFSRKAVTALPSVCATTVRRSGPPEHSISVLVENWVRRDLLRDGHSPPLSALYGAPNAHRVVCDTLANDETNDDVSITASALHATRMRAGSSPSFSHVEDAVSSRDIAWISIDPPPLGASHVAPLVAAQSPPVLSVARTVRGEEPVLLRIPLMCQPATSPLLPPPPPPFLDEDDFLRPAYSCEAPPLEFEGKESVVDDDVVIAEMRWFEKSDNPHQFVTPTVSDPLECDEGPVLPLPYPAGKSAVDPLTAALLLVTRNLEVCADSALRAVTRKEDRLQWWEKRRRADRGICSAAWSLEAACLGVWSFLLAPSEPADETALFTEFCEMAKDFGVQNLDVVRKFLKIFVSSALPSEFSHICAFALTLQLIFMVGQGNVIPGSLSMQKRIVTAVLDAHRVSYDVEVNRLLRSLIPELRTVSAYALLLCRGARDTTSHAVLVLDPCLNLLPWELTPTLRERKVSRLPTLSLAPCEAFGSDSTYLVNPDGSLQDVDAVAATLSMLGWRRHRDFGHTFFYVGHGSGSHYVKPRDSHSRVFLFGCSSTSETGRVGLQTHYLMRSPVVVGALWDVTSFDVVRLAEATARELNDDVVAAVQHGRATVRLRGITGGAFVVWGW